MTKVFAYTQFIDCYNTFCLNQTGLPAKIDVIQGKAAKELIKYIVYVLEHKNKTEPTEDEVVSSMIWVFTRWKSLSQYHQSQIKLTQINSNFPNIINELKNGHSKTKPITESKSLLDRINDDIARFANQV